MHVNEYCVCARADIATIPIQILHNDRIPISCRDIYYCFLVVSRTGKKNPPRSNRAVHNTSISAEWYRDTVLCVCAVYWVEYDFWWSIERFDSTRFSNEQMKKTLSCLSICIFNASTNPPLVNKSNLLNLFLLRPRTDLSLHTLVVGSVRTDRTPGTVTESTNHDVLLSRNENQNTNKHIHRPHPSCAC